MPEERAHSYSLRNSEKSIRLVATSLPTNRRSEQFKTHGDNAEAKSTDGHNPDVTATLPVGSSNEIMATVLTASPQRPLIQNHQFPPHDCPSIRQATSECNPSTLIEPLTYQSMRWHDGEPTVSVNCRFVNSPYGIAKILNHQPQKIRAITEQSTVSMRWHDSEPTFSVQSDALKPQEVWDYSTFKSRETNSLPIQPCSDQNILIPPSVWTKPLNRVQGIIAGQTITLIMDDGANGSILPRKPLEQLLQNVQLHVWTGPQVRTPHSPFKCDGELIQSIQLGSHQVMMRWCVVSDTYHEPLIGQDFIQHYKIFHNWQEGIYQGTMPDTKEVLRIPILHAPIHLRSGKVTTLQPGQGKWITCPISQQRESQDWLIEPAITTAGALRVMSSMVTIHPHSCNVNVFLANWTQEEITIQNGALLAHAHPVDNVRPEADVQIASVKSYSEHSISQRNQAVQNAQVGQQLTNQEVKEARRFLTQYQDLFSINPSAPDTYNGPKFNIDTGTNPPSKEMPRRQAPWKEAEISKQINAMLDNDIIEPSMSPWAAPVVLAQKKDGSWRFCVDYRQLNQLTRKDSYALPRIDDTIDAIGPNNRVYSTMDVSSGYWHIPIEEADREKTAFTCREGLYQFKVMPFGLSNAPAVFTRAMDNTLRGLLFKTVLVFVDDIVCFTPDFESHKTALAEVFDRLLKHGFSLKLSKCLFFSDTITYLGFVIHDGHVSVDPKKIEAIAEYSPPTSLKSLQRYLGMVQWYRRFIPNFAKIAKPLYDLLRTTESNKWEIDEPNSEQNQAFEHLRQALMSYPILRLPDFSKPFLVITDASKYAVGGMLAQEHDNFEHPIHYVSKAITGALTKAHSYEQEAFALIVCLKAFRHYLLGTHFTVITDCRALSHFNTTKEISPKVERWLSFIQSFDITFVHRDGNKIVTSDALSRDERFHSKTEFKAGPYFNLQDATVNLTYVASVADEKKLGSKQFKEMQAYNRKISQLVDYLKEGTLPSDPDARLLIISEARGLVLSGGLLCKAPENGQYGICRPYVPGTMRNSIIKACHDDILAGHPGIQRTQQKIALRYYWPTLNADVADYVRNCASCNLNKKLGNERKVAMQPLSIMTPWSLVQLDYIVVAKEKKDASDWGNRYILTMIDAFSKHVELVALEESTALVTKIHFESRIILRWGVPEVVMTDGGPSFKGEFNAFLQELGIKHVTAIAYQHRTMGLVERMNRSVRQTIRHYLDARRKNWDQNLAEVQFAINTTTSSTIGLSPYAINHGREPRLPIQNLIDAELDTSQIEPTHEDLISVATNTEALVETAQKNMKKTHQKWIEKSSEKAYEEPYEMYSYVMRYVNRNKSKLDPIMEGPYQVVERDEQFPANYILENPYVGYDSRVKVHVADLVPYKGKIPKKRTLLKSQELDETRFNSKKFSDKLAYAKKNTETPFSVTNLIGRHVQIYWTQSMKHGWWSGVIVDYDPHISRFWVKYDDPDADGTDHYEEDLLGSNPPQWEFIPADAIAYRDKYKPKKK